MIRHLPGCPSPTRRCTCGYGQADHVELAIARYRRALAADGYDAAEQDRRRDEQAERLGFAASDAVVVG